MNGVITLSSSHARKAGLPSGYVLIKPKFAGEFEFEYEGAKRSIKWYVVENRVILDQRDDYEKLTHGEKIELFNPILSQYRLLSNHPDKFYSSAIGVTEDGQIFISENKQRQKDFHKDCAEIGVVNSIPNLETNKIVELYIQVGFHDPKNPDSPASGSEKTFLPCGKCTDCLAQAMAPNATLVTMPANDGKKVPPINYTAHSLKEVEPGQIWSTEFAKVNKDFTLHLNSYAANLGREAKLELISTRKPWTEKIKPALEYYQKFNLSSWIKKLPREVRHYVEILLDPNNPDNRVHAIDADPSLSSINSYMHNEIVRAYKNREKKIKKEDIADIKVRCVLARTSDGKFKSTVETSGLGDSAVTEAETSITTMISPLCTTDVWVKEMRFTDIDEGKMQTSPKEGLERLYKRRPLENDVTDWEGKLIKGTINIRYIPFNNGKLNDDEVQKITRFYKIEDIFGSLFQGSKEIIRNNGHATSHNSKHR